MTAFKKIESDPVVEKKTETTQYDPQKFRALSNLYWPIAEYGASLGFDPPDADYPIWPSLNYNSQSFLYQSTESVKYFIDFYQGNVIPVNVSTFPGFPSGDFSYSFNLNETENLLVDYYLYFVPTQTRLFSVAWAHYAGSGGIDSSFGGQYTYPTKAVYNQAKMVLSDITSSKFELNNEELDHFFIMSFDQKNLSGSITPNSFLLPLQKMSALGGQGDETQGETHTFTDFLQETLYSNKFGYYSYLVSGNLNQISSSEIFGAIYYDQKTVLLNTEKLQNTVFYSPSSLGSIINTGSIPTGGNDWYLSGSQSTNSYMLGRLLRNSQFKNTGFDTPITAIDFQFKLTYDEFESIYFLNIGQDDFNYTNNPSCFSADFYDTNSKLYGKKFKYDSFKSTPVTYITTIGLYNDNRELLAIAKLPYPLKKDFSTRYLLKILIKY